MADEHRRWHEWQQRQAVQYLPPRMVDEGYTIVRIDKESRGLFLELVPMLNLYGRLQRQRTPDLEACGMVQTWRTWTQTLLATLTALSRRQRQTVTPDA
jgi:hypothetical protein